MWKYAESDVNASANVSYYENKLDFVSVSKNIRNDKQNIKAFFKENS